MRFLFYTHSLVSDWNHGNAHFLRGVMRELGKLGHETMALEPADGWSRLQLLREAGPDAETDFHLQFPIFAWKTYNADFNHEEALARADVVIVHEWTDPALVMRIGRARKSGGHFRLLFHDTHHRAVSATQELSSLDLDGYDLVLAFGESLREQYLRRGWGRSVVTWHEAADVDLFHPHPEIAPENDLVWIGNWGDGERTNEIREFLLGPVSRLRLGASVHGVRYPAEALAELDAAGIRYGGWIANARVPAIFARHRVTVHVPRRPYATSLPGIPTIRMFEALACGIPLVSAPWDDCESLFRTGEDYRVARNGREMERHLRKILSDREAANALSRSGLETVLARHTCRHRVVELLGHLEALGAPGNSGKEAAE